MCELVRPAFYKLLLSYTHLSQKLNFFHIQENYNKAVFEVQKLNYHYDYFSDKK